jgi:hypothetical protein
MACRTCHPSQCVYNVPGDDLATALKASNILAADL